MSIRIPDTLTVDNSGKYIISIRLRSDGFSFSGHIPSSPGSFFYEDTLIDRSVPFVDAFKEIFFANDFFTWNYKHINIVTETVQYTLVPDAIADGNSNDQFLRFAFLQPPAKTLSVALEAEKAVVLFGLENELYEFCSRSFINPFFIPHILPLLTFARKQSIPNPSRSMYVVIRNKELDILVYDNPQLHLVNTFSVNGTDDMVYIILYIWKQIRMEPETDRLMLFGESVVRNKLTDSLAAYLRNIGSVELPSEVYLMGSAMNRVPLDIAVLTLCE